MKGNLLNITEAADFLDVSVATLRRWDKSGKLSAIRKEGGVHRYYHERDLLILKSDLVKLAYDWTIDGHEIASTFYCSNGAVFQSKLIKMQDLLLQKNIDKNLVPLIVAVAGEVGNNSFDHNLGNWPDVPGIFFGYDVHKKQIILADRGQGVLTTLKRVRPNLKNHLEALRVAFTEIVSGRAPEERGNGLKFVRQVIAGNPISLFFQSGDAELRLKKEEAELRITRSAENIRGCFAVIEF